MEEILALWSGVVVVVEPEEINQWKQPQKKKTKNKEAADCQL